METRIHLDDQADASACVTSGVRHPARRFEGIEADCGGDAPRERGQPLQLFRSHDRVADEDVGDACIGHHGRLAQLRDLHATRAGIELHPRDLHHLVGLDVRPEHHPGHRRALRHAGHVAGHDRAVHHQAWRVPHLFGQGTDVQAADPGLLRGRGRGLRSGHGRALIAPVPSWTAVLTRALPLPFATSETPR